MCAVGFVGVFVLVLELLCWFCCVVLRCLGWASRCCYVGVECRVVLFGNVLYSHVVLSCIVCVVVFVVVGC